jgi:hypothetical protein
LDGSGAPTEVTPVPEPFTVTEIVRPVKLETPQPFTALCTRKQYGPVVLKFPELPPVAIAEQLPPELELLEVELVELVLEVLEVELVELVLEVLEVEEVVLLELLDGQMPEPPLLVEEDELGPSLKGMLSVASWLSGLEPNWLKAATAMI